MSAPATESPIARVGGVLRSLRSKQGRTETLAGLRGSDTGKAAGLAGAMIANNVIALVSTVVFARELNDYGSLGALISYLLILTVAGQAMQVATAREGVLGHLGLGHDLVATTKAWTRSMLVIVVTLTVVSVLFRQPIANAVGVHRYPWAAAFGLPAGCLYLEVSLLRGALQGIGDYRSVGISLVGEQACRLFAGAILAIGLNVTGAYIGSLLSYVAMSAYCIAALHRYAARHDTERSLELAAREPAMALAAMPAGAPEGVAAESLPELDGPTVQGGRGGIRRGAVTGPAISLWAHVRRAWAPIAGLVVIAVLQNIDIIAAKHQFTTRTASSYAAVAVAAKVLIWVAIGAGFYLVPEVSRRRAEGLDTRSVLIKALGIILVCAIPCLLIFAGGSHILIKTVFGAKKAGASDSLLILGLAFTVLSATYLAIQYMLALKHTWFLLVLAVVAIAEPILLLNASHKPASFAAVVLGIQAAAAVLAFGFALRRDSARPASAT